MNQRNASKKSQAVRINITLPLPEKQESTPDKLPCPDGCGGKCSTCGKSGQVGEPNPLLQQAGQILVKLLTGQYKPEQYEGAFDVLDTILRRHYDRSSKQ